MVANMQQNGQGRVLYRNGIDLLIMVGPLNQHGQIAFELIRVLTSPFG